MPDSNDSSVGWVSRNARVAESAAPVGELVEAELEFASLGGTELRGRLARLVSMHMPPALAARCTFGPLRSGRLVVYVDCPTHLYELRTRWAASLCRALRAAELPTPVRSVVFRLGGASPA